MTTLIVPPAHPAIEVFARALSKADSRATPLQVLELLGVRVSSQSIKHLRVQFDAARQVFENHPVAGPFLNGLPEDILTHADDAYRESFGLFRLEDRHTIRGATGAKRFGYVACPVVDGVGCLIPIVANTSREKRVQTENGLANGWQGIIEAGWSWAAAARCMRFVADHRQGRNEVVFATIIEKVKERPGALVYWGHERLDPQTDSWKAVINARRSADEDDSRRDRTTAGACRKLNAGAWMNRTCPVGTRTARTRNVRGELVPDKDGRLELDPDQSAVLTRALTGFANGESKTSIADAIAALGARDGNGLLVAFRTIERLDVKGRCALVDQLEQLPPGSVGVTEIAQLRERIDEPVGPTQRELSASSAGHVVDRILRGARHLRSGVVDIVRIAPTAGRMEYQGWYPTYPVQTAAHITHAELDRFVLESELEPDHPFWRLPPEGKERARRCGFWRFRFECGSPVDLPVEIWDKIEARLARDAETHQRRAASRRARPLCGLTWFDEHGHRYRFSSGGDAMTYSLQVAERSDGAQTRWSHLHTFRSEEAARAVGDLLLGLVDRSDAEMLDLLSPQVVKPEVSPLSAAEALLDQLQSELVDCLPRLEAFQLALIEIDEAASAGTLSPATAALRRQSTERARASVEERVISLQDDLIPEAGSAIETLRLCPTPTTSSESPAGAWEEVDADFGHLAAVGLGLLRCNPYGPAPLSDALSWLLDGGAGLHNLRVGEHDRQILIDVRVRVLTADGSTEWIDAGTLDFTDRRLSKTRGPELVDDAARRLLRDGEPLAALAARYSWPEGEVLRRVAGWLSRSIERHFVRSAAVTAAASSPDLPTGRVIYAVITGDGEGLKQCREQFGSWIVDQICAAYLGPQASWAHSTGWLRRPLGVNRACMLAAAQAGMIRRETLIASVPGLTSDERLKDDVVAGRTSFWQPPLNMTDGWVSPHRCERPSCPGGGSSPMTGLLPVPELIAANAAVYCEFCFCPLGRDEPLPEPYTRLWDIDVAVSSLDRADGVAHVAHGVPIPHVAPSPMRTRDVARMSGLPRHAIQRLALDGRIPSVLGPNGKRVYDSRQMSSRQVRHVFAEEASALPGRESHAVGGPGGTDLLDGAAARARLGIPGSVLRLLVRKGALANLGSHDAPAYHCSAVEDLLDRIRAVTGSLTATLACTSVIDHVATEFGVTTATIRRMLTAGVLESVDLHGATLVLNESIELLDPRTREAMDPANRLVASDVAARANLHESTVLHYVKRGDLPAVQLYPRARLYFLEAEVDAWLQGRAGAGGDSSETDRAGTRRST